MKQEWVNVACSFAGKKADFYSGARKIIRGRSFEFNIIENDLVMADCGFTKSKMTMLKKLYLHEESRDMAVEMWKGRLARKKYGSVCFHTYNHLVKGGDLETKRSKRASVMGPCLQAVSITLLNNGQTAIDVFYRTTELFKKFPADLVFLRDEVLSPFDFSTAPIESITFHFANITIHPMYWVTVIPLLDDPIATMEMIKKRDKHFYDWCIKWTARYVCKEHHRGIAKFAQAQRTKMDALNRIDKRLLPKLQQYLRDNHPGHRNQYTEADDAENE